MERGTGGKPEIQNDHALIIVDVQNDFCPGGAVPVDKGDEIVPVLNRCMSAATSVQAPVFASRDWHPLDHVSFRDQGGDWPPHCIQDTDGANFHPQLDLPQTTVKITKGVRLDHDQVSAFDQTGLTRELRKRRIKTVWIGGLAQDTGVFLTTMEARREGFEILVIENGIRPFTPENGERTRRAMRGPGIRFVTYK